MQACSQAYKSFMKEKWRDRPSYMRVTLGVVNQEAQATAYVPSAPNYTYYSNLKMPLEGYEVQELYAACDQDYAAVDGSMYFLPRDSADVVLNQGIVTERAMGDIKVRFPVPYNIMGLTIDFGKAYPAEFRIESDNGAVDITGNPSGHFRTEEIFHGATFLRFVPVKMVNGQGRLRIHKLTVGVGLSFGSRQILSATKREHISPVMDDLPAVDFELAINNKDRAFDVENDESSVNFLEIGQEVKVMYGQELEDGTVEWMPGATVYLREWSADDKEMSFTATDRFDSMAGTYYRGEYSAGGTSLYDLAVDVLGDAGIDSRAYWLDAYLKDVRVCNPVPAVAHKEALQLIANAGRCLLYQDRDGKIFIRSSFLPDMSASSDDEAYFSHAGRVLDGTPKDCYALAGRDEADAVPTQYFLPRRPGDAVFLNTGYVSEAVAGLGGRFDVPPKVEIQAEAAFRCFDLTLEFGRHYPAEMVIHTFRDGDPQEDYTVTEIQEVTSVRHEFPEFDRMVLEFTRHNAPPDLDGDYTFWADRDGACLLDEDGAHLVAEGEPIPQMAYNRVVLNNITFGDSTDYRLEYGCELTRTPKGKQMGKVRELQIARTMYAEGTERKALVRETVPVLEGGSRHTFYLSSPAHGYKASIVDPAGSQDVRIAESSAYYVTVELSGAAGAAEVEISGYEYIMTQALVSRQLNPTGSLETWENPLVSDPDHAADLAGWVGDYLRADREYELNYRGEPRIDANDILFLENKYVPNLLVRVFEHTLRFNGGLAGTIKARRDMGHEKKGEGMP